LQESGNENTRTLIGNPRFKANASKNLIDLIVESRKIRTLVRHRFLIKSLFRGRQHLIIVRPFDFISITLER